MGDEAMTEKGEVDVPIVDLATIVAGVVSRVLPRAVEDAVRAEMDRRVDGLATLLDKVVAATERGAFDDVHDRIVGLYARHLARVAIESGVGVGEYAKMARDAKKGE